MKKMKMVRPPFQVTCVSKAKMKDTGFQNLLKQFLVKTMCVLRGPHRIGKSAMFQRQ